MLLIYLYISGAIVILYMLRIGMDSSFGFKVWKGMDKYIGSLYF